MRPFFPSLVQSVKPNTSTKGSIYEQSKRFDYRAIPVAQRDMLEVGSVRNLGAYSSARIFLLCYRGFGADAREEEDEANEGGGIRRRSHAS